MKTRKLTRLQGYIAASRNIQALMDDAKLQKRDADYWEGYRAGLLAAHSQLALGIFPNHPHNAPMIRRALKQ